MYSKNRLKRKFQIYIYYIARLSELNKNDNVTYRFYFHSPLHSSSFRYRSYFSSLFYFFSCQTDLQKYHDTYFSRSGVNQMWILKTQKTCWRLNVLDFSMFVTRFQTFDISTLYTTIPAYATKI